MPNPLSKVQPNAVLFIGPGAVQEEPELAKWITNIVTIWPHLENQLGFSLARFLDGEAHVGVAIYNALTGSTAQRAILLNAAQTALEGDEALPLFMVLLDVTKSLAKRRAPLAHDMWASSPQVPDALLCIKAELQLKRRGVAAREWADWLRTDTTLTDPPKVPNLDASEIQVYTEKDFTDLFNDLRALIMHFSDFWMMRDDRPPGRAELRSKLENAPLLRERIRQKREADQSARKSPPQSPPPEPPQK